MARATAQVKAEASGAGEFADSILMAARKRSAKAPTAKPNGAANRIRKRMPPKDRYNDAKNHTSTRRVTGSSAAAGSFFHAAITSSAARGAPNSNRNTTLGRCTAANK